MKKTYALLAALLAMALVIASCGGGGGGGGTQPPIDNGGGGGGGGGDTTPTTTTVSGKVTLSSTVSSKPSLYAAKMVSRIRAAQSKTAYKPLDAGMTMSKVLNAAGISQEPDFLGSATVELYNADKAEWLYPVAVALTDGSGNYTLDTLMNGSNNKNADGSAAYVDGDPIPVGNFTVIASKYDPNVGKLFVAVQAVIKKFAGSVAGNDLTAQDSDAVPAIVSMFGLPKNLDGTYGSSTTLLPSNSSIQITFSMAMARMSVTDAANIKNSSGTAVPGTWKVSPDLVTASFTPTSPLSPNAVYTVAIGGGNATKTAKNLYGKKMAATVTGTFKTSQADNSAPNAIKDRPNVTLDSETNSINSIRITSPVRIATDEPIDVDSLTVSSTPSIGDKPFVKFIGKLDAAKAYQNYYFVYEIVPSVPLKLNTPYSISISGVKDLAGNVLTAAIPISFTTEAASAGIDTSGSTTEVNAQIAVKDVLGKWINAMNSRNSTLLTSYMSGDFYWLNDSSQGMSSDDLNRDGRLSLNEFTKMLQNWFKQLESCGATVTGDIIGSISFANATTANIAFNLIVSSTNENNQECKDSGPSSALYATLQNINSAWLMTRGADFEVTTFPPPLKIVDLAEPTNGAQLPEPAPTAPLMPEFKWTVPEATPAITTYMVVLIDNRSPWQETGWAALVDPLGAAAESKISVKFNPKPGDYGTVLIPLFSDEGNNPFGFRKMIKEILPGGDYSWAVLGFREKTVNDFKVLNFDPGKYLAASSASYNFTVGGSWKALSVVIKNSAGTAYSFSDWNNGYDVGSAGTVFMTVTTPNTTATSGCYEMDGYTRKSGQLAFTSGVSSPVQLDLSNKGNWLWISDNCTGGGTNGGSSEEETGLKMNFNIFTTGGIMPKITFSSITGKKCDGTATSLGTVNAWGQYPLSADVCTLDIAVNVSNAGISNLYLNVWNDDGKGEYRKEMPVTSGAAVFNNVPVYQGRNWINIGGWDEATQTSHSNNFGVETAAGSTYVAPITASVNGLTPTSTSMFEKYYDAGSVSSVTINGTMSNVNAACSPGYGGCSGWSHNVDPNWQWVGNGQITASPFSIPFTLYQGWNYIDLQDGAGNWFRLYIFTTGGDKYQAPNAITMIDTTAVTGYFTYNTSECSVNITGETKTLGTVNVSMNNYNAATGQSMYEWQQIPESELVSIGSGLYQYTFPLSVYSGSNDISTSDGNWNWSGLRVEVTNAGCAAILFDVKEIRNGSGNISPDANGDYNAGNDTQYVTIKGTAKAGKTITVNVSGNYYTQVSGVADSINTFSIPNVPVYAGYNYLSINDGNGWIYKNVYTNGNGATWTPPLVITAVTGDGTYMSKTAGGSSSETWSNWSTDADTITITGTSTIDGAGTWSQSGASYNSGTFNVSGNAFTVSGLQLGYGSNYFSFYDANWNYYSISIYTTSGTGAPVKYVTIDSPSHDTTVTAGQVAVSGTVTSDASFTPVYVYAYIYDYVTNTSTYHSSVSSDLSYGYQPVTFNSTTGTFSFNAAVTAGNTTSIEVYAYDSNWNSHGQYIYVNNSYGYTPYSWKPGSKPTRASSAAQAHKIEFLKRIMNK